MGVLLIGNKINPPIKKEFKRPLAQIINFPKFIQNPQFQKVGCFFFSPVKNPAQIPLKTTPKF